jgi:hypothetical protein
MLYIRSGCEVSDPEAVVIVTIGHCTSDSEAENQIQRWRLCQSLYRWLLVEERKERR